MELVVTLIVIIFIVFLGLHDVTQFFLEDKDSRTYWIKWWVAVSLILGIAFWVLLMFSGE